MTITELDAAEREIVAAIQLLFDGGDPIPVCVPKIRFCLDAGNERSKLAT
jgi:hypothetical protein